MGEKAPIEGDREFFTFAGYGQFGESLLMEIHIVTFFMSMYKSLKLIPIHSSKLGEKKELLKGLLVFDDNQK